MSAPGAPDAPDRPGETEPLSAFERRALRLEIGLVLAVTFGLSAVTASLQLIDFVLRGLAGQRVALNPKRSYFDLIDLGLNLAYITQLLAWGALAVYLLWRSGFTPARIGLGRLRWRPDLLGGLGLAALIGIPGLALYVASRALGFSVAVVPSELDDTWWRIPVLLLVSFANGWAEEVVVVGFLLTRLRQLDVSPTTAIVASSVLRGAYHLYQGFGAGLGNLAMGLVFGWVWHRTGRLWPLVIAHGIIDSVAFVGYALLAPHLGWLGIDPPSST
ncbi:CPBP family intramembrane glutamic endopeptidase [Mycolicibacterium confluentis]|uniref:Abortive infection protein n=1 Tax=Mycolicibacterium confluentis TaxID=28047 RepID=A0A7I7Y4R5_9MYCO|nr:CPBP family intramembrane metalloprotease [Mycolicibacterium confluentis]BBZ36656.1 abortive infection protein [Mycolicibacterium confluentis]